MGALASALALLAAVECDRFYGPCFNPAIGVSLTLYQNIQLRGYAIHGEKYLYEYLWAYTLGPAIGGTLAGLVFILHEQRVS